MASKPGLFTAGKDLHLRKALQFSPFVCRLFVGLAPFRDALIERKKLIAQYRASCIFDFKNRKLRSTKLVRCVCSSICPHVWSIRTKKLVPENIVPGNTKVLEPAPDSAVETYRRVILISEASLSTPCWSYQETLNRIESAPGRILYRFSKGGWHRKKGYTEKKDLAESSPENVWELKANLYVLVADNDRIKKTI